MIWKPVHIRQDRKLVPIDPGKIVFLRTDKNYTSIYVEGEKSPFMVRSTLDKVLEKLPEEIFIKVNRSWAASILFVDAIHRDHLEVGVNSIPVSKMHYPRIIKKLSIIE